MGEIFDVIMEGFYNEEMLRKNMWIMLDKIEILKIIMMRNED